MGIALLLFKNSSWRVGSVDFSLEDLVELEDIFVSSHSLQGDASEDRKGCRVYPCDYKNTVTMKSDYGTISS